MRESREPRQHAYTSSRSAIKTSSRAPPSRRGAARGQPGCGERGQIAGYNSTSHESVRLVRRHRFSSDPPARPSEVGWRYVGCRFRRFARRSLAPAANGLGLGVLCARLPGVAKASARGPGSGVGHLVSSATSRSPARACRVRVGLTMQIRFHTVALPACGLQSASLRVESPSALWGRLASSRVRQYGAHHPCCRWY